MVIVTWSTLSTIFYLIGLWSTTSLLATLALVFWRTSTLEWLSVSLCCTSDIADYAALTLVVLIVDFTHLPEIVGNNEGEGDPLVVLISVHTKDYHEKNEFAEQR